MSNGFLKKGCLFQTAFAIVVVYTVWWLVVGINTVNTLPVALASAFVPLGGLILSLYKQHIGGLLIIFSGILPLIILANTPKGDFFYLGMAIFTIFVTLPLCFAGGIIAVAPSKKPLEPLKRGRKYMKPPKKGKLHYNSNSTIFRIQDDINSLFLTFPPILFNFHSAAVLKY